MILEMVIEMEDDTHFAKIMDNLEQSKEIKPKKEAMWLRKGKRNQYLGFYLEKRGFGMYNKLNSCYW
jgi:hypothetical protein